MKVKNEAEKKECWDKGERYVDIYIYIYIHIYTYINICIYILAICILKLGAVHHTY
jgi:hypothetical protein